MHRRSKSESISYPTVNGIVNLPKLGSRVIIFGDRDNKILLQNFLKHYILKNEEFQKYDILFSTINDYPSTSSKQNRCCQSLKNLQRFDIEEADVKIIVHIQHAVSEGHKNIYLISSDTDVLILSLYFWYNFKCQGLEVTIYIQY